MYNYFEMNISAHVNIIFPFCSTANFKCTASDRHMYLQGYMYPSLGTPDLELQQASSRYWLSSWKQSNVDPHQTRYKFAY